MSRPPRSPPLPYQLAWLALALAGLSCATARPAGSPPDTVVRIDDESGDSLPGVLRLSARGVHDACSIEGADCAVALPAGEYWLRFQKTRAGRTGGSIGSAPNEGRGGCLVARVRLQPGQRLVCRKRGPYSCARGVRDTLDCGAATLPSPPASVAVAGNDDEDQ